ncbi:EamA family transporter [Longispora albida]|uniref:EamA family transporter n=1 Tax=Longispora albida TaxID=203523 RepID=UPI00036AA656|nr:EamA family transporter [Longispora albida]
MPPAAIALVVAAAFCHAGWNLAAKRAGTAGPGLLWLSTVVSTVLYAPLLFFVDIKLNWAVAGVILASSVIHLAYFVVLQRGYAVGDLSVVYPLARGTGPLLSVVVAVVVLGERPGWFALAGAGAVVAGILIVSWSGKNVNVASLGYGVATGVLIAGYTIFDAQAVGPLAIAPLFFDWASNLVRMVYLTPYTVRNKQKVREVWRAHKREVLVIAGLSPLAYILVLYAYRYAPVSLVAPARELSIVVGSVLGWLLLREPNPVRRLLGAAVVLGGVVVLAAA